MSELFQKLKQQSAARKEQHRKVLSELGNHYDDLGKHFLELKGLFIVHLFYSNSRFCSIQN